MKIISLLLTTVLLANISFANLVIYTDRNPAVFADAITEFETTTGVKVDILSDAYDKLATRVEAIRAMPDVENPDLFITKDIVFFSDLKSRGLTKAFTGLDTTRLHPAMFDTDRNYVGLTYRARTIAYGATVDASELTTYEDLADPKWAGRLCLRQGMHTYNLSLVSYLIAKHGEVKAKSIVQGWLDNLAAPIFPNDRAILQAIASGQDCEVAIVNHYYLAGEIASHPNFPVKMAFLEQGAGGVHTNGMGAVLLSTSKQEAIATQFVQLLLTDKYQLQLSGAHFDYPVIQGLEASTFVSTWGPFEVDRTPWSDVGQNVKKAAKILTELGYN